MRTFALAAVAALVAGGTASAQTFISYTGVSYAQDFNGLASSSSPAWSNNSPFQTLTGWSAYRAGSAGINGLRDSTGNNITAYTASNGGSNAGTLYSFGATSDSDRALGHLGSNSTGDALIMFAVRNDTGSALTEFTLSWDLEQWRQGGQSSNSPAIGTQHSLVVDYKIASSIGLSDTSASFTTGFVAPGAAWNGTGPVATAAGTGAAVDGNTTGLQAGRGGTITGLTWNPGEILMIRWWDDNNTGNDHGLAIDNVRFTAIPTPGALALVGLGGLALARRRR